MPTKTPVRCKAKANRTGARCGNWPIRGAVVCHKHGGSSPQVRAAARRRLQRQQLDGDLGKLLAELEIDAAERHPVQLLLDALARTWSMVNVLGALVGGLGTDATGSGGLAGPNHLGDGAPHVLVDMYGVWLDKAARTSKLALDAGVEERAVRIEEERGRLIADVFRQVFADAELGLTAEQRRTAASITVRHLRAIDGGAS
jgi:hypothetical protein